MFPHLTTQHTQQMDTMQTLKSLFQQNNIDLYLVGTAARNFIRTGEWGNPGILEYIALAPRKKVLDLQGIPLRATQPRGPIQVNLSLHQHPFVGYITCAPPGSSPTETLKQALTSRGFSIDTLALNANNEIIDPLQAKSDLEKGLIRTISNDNLSFGSDALAFIRLAGLVSELGTKAPEDLKELVTQQAGKILHTPRSGWLRELTALLCGPHVSQALQLLYDTRILGLLLPEVHAMIGFAETSRYHHKDLWAHTKQVVSQAHPTPLVRWAALLHDMGKSWTRTYGNNKDVHFFQHGELGAILVEGISARFRMDPTFQEHLAFLVRHHQRPNEYQSHWSDSAVRRLLRDAGALLQPLLWLSQADFTSAIPQKRLRAETLSRELKTRITRIKEEDEKRPALPKGIGSEIIHAFAFTPGPRIGRIKRYLEQQIEANHIQPHQESSYYITYLKTQPHLPE